MFGRFRGTMTLIAACVAVYVLDALTGQALLFRGALSPAVWGGEWWRLLTPNFIHSGITHIAFNMYALYIFGRIVEQLIGTRRFFVVYFVSGLSGFALSLLANPGALAVGASAAIFGLMGFTLHFRIRRLPLHWSPMDSAFLQIFGLNLILGFVVPNIDHWAHMGGLAGGVLAGGLVGLPTFARTMSYEGVVESRVVGRGSVWAEKVLAGLFIGALVFMSLSPISFAKLTGHRGFEQAMDTRYGAFFSSFRAVETTILWRDIARQTEWRPLDGRLRRDDPRTTVGIGLFWRWEAGAKRAEPTSFSVEWRRLLINGRFETVHTDYGEVTAPDRRIGYVFLRSAMSETAVGELDGSWQVRVEVGGREQFVEEFTVSPLRQTI